MANNKPLTNEQMQADINRLKSQIKKAETEQENNKNDIVQTNKQVNEYEDNKTALLATIDEIRKAIDPAKNELEKMKSEKQDKENKIKQLQQAKENNDKSVIALNQQLVELKKKVLEEDQKATIQKQAVEENLRQAEQVEKQHLMEELKYLQERTKQIAIEKQIEALKQLQRDLETNADIVKDKLAKIDQEINDLKTQEMDLQKQLDQLNMDLAELRAQLRTLIGEIMELQKQLAGLKKQLGMKFTQLQDLQERLASANQMEQELQQRKQQILQEINRLQKEIEGLQIARAAALAIAAASGWWSLGVGAAIAAAAAACLGSMISAKQHALKSQQGMLDVCDSQLRQVAKDKATLNQDIKNIQQEIVSLSDQSEKKQAILNEREAERNKTRQSIEQKEAAKERVIESLVQVRGEIAAKQEYKQSCSMEMDQIKQKIQLLETDMIKQTAVASQTTQAYYAAKQKVRQEYNSLDKGAKAFGKILEDRNNADVNLESWQRKANSAKLESEEIERRIAINEQEIAELDKCLENVDSQCKKAHEESQKAIGKYTEYLDSVNEAKNKLKELQKIKQEVEARLATSKEQLTIRNNEKTNRDEAEKIAKEAAKAKQVAQAKSNS